QSIIGQVGNIAFQVQQQAENSGVTISGSTERLIRGRFSCERLPVQVSSGKGPRLEVFRVHPGIERRNTIPPKPLSPLIGRDIELALLVDRFDDVKGGAGHVALLVAEPGLGKSRLLSAFQDALPAVSHRWLLSRCAPDFQSTPYHPLTL